MCRGVQASVPLKNSGETVVSDSLTLNVLSVFDQDNWVAPSDDSKINIALYHGAISGVSTDIGWVMDHGEHDVGIFEGHDYAFLGDIHKTNQVLDHEGRVRYCGSTVQQNHGEKAHQRHVCHFWLHIDSLIDHQIQGEGEWT